MLKWKLTYWHHLPHLIICKEVVQTQIQHLHWYFQLQQSDDKAMCPKAEKHSSSFILCWKELLQQDSALNLKPYHALLFKPKEACLWLNKHTFMVFMLQGRLDSALQKFYPQKSCLIIRAFFLSSSKCLSHFLSLPDPAKLGISPESKMRSTRFLGNNEATIIKMVLTSLPLLQ